MTTVPSSAAMIEPSLKPGRQRDEREDRRDGRHQDRPDAGPAALDQGLSRRLAARPQPLDEVEQDDRVGDHDPDQHQEADEGADADRPVPVKYSAGKAPIVASGRLNRMMNGVISELNVRTIIT